MEGIQKKIAVLNDLSGYGRCSLTAAMPVISALKVQCCPVVTAVLSNPCAARALHTLLVESTVS